MTAVCVSANVEEVEEGLQQQMQVAGCETLAFILALNTGKLRGLHRCVCLCVCRG